MSSRRTLILIAAIVIGALAAYAVVTYVGGVEDRANDNARRVPVMRVKETIPRGTRGQEAVDQSMLEEAEIASEFFPPTAIEPHEIEVILAKAAVSDLAPGQVLVEDMFVDPINSQITAARRITQGHVAITISVDDIRGVAGLIVPGDFVNIMVVQPGDECRTGDPLVPGEEAAPDLPLTAVLCRQARSLYQAARVLFIDNSPIQLPGEAATVAADGTAAPVAANTGLITLQVPPSAAQYIASAPADGFYLTLLPEDYTPTPLPRLDPTITLLPGEDGALLTPYGPDGFPEDSDP